MGSNKGLPGRVLRKIFPGKPNGNRVSGGSTMTMMPFQYFMLIIFSFRRLHF